MVRKTREYQGYTDSDWAGCRRTARSTSGGVVMIGTHLIKSWSATQKSVTLSSGEAELVAAVKMATELIGLCQLAADWGWETRGQIFTDSSAAIGTASRRGNGKMRHVRVGMLWIQEQVEDGSIGISKVKGEDNPADVLTKDFQHSKLFELTRRASPNHSEGRVEAGLVLACN